MEKCKRLLALILAVCLALPAIVPAVRAEDVAVNEVESVVYNFDYYSAIAPSEPAWTNVETAWMYLEHTDKAGVEDATINKTQLDGFYADGTLNWKLTNFKSSYAQSKLRVASFVAPNQGTNQQDYGYFRLGAMEGDWVAFTIKNPRANTKHKITMKYTTYSYGASVGSVYILPADTKDIEAAISEAEAIGSVNFENSEQGKETPNIPAVTAPIGFWTPGDAEEYIIVLEATKGAGGEKTKGWGYVFLSELTMDAVAEAEETDKEVIYNFDYYEIVAPGLPGNDTDGVGNCYLYSKTEPTALTAEIQTKYESDILNWKYQDGYYTYTSVQKLRFIREGFTEKSNTTQDGFLVARAKVGDWMAFTIKNPGAGIQRTVTMTHPTSKYGAGSSNVYILPGDTQNIGETIKEAEPIGSVSYYNKDVSSCEVPAVLMSNSTVGVWTPGDAEEYIFVVEATEADDAPGVAPYAYMYISKLIMGDGSNITIDPVKPEVVAEDIIRSSEFEEAAIGVNPANGHDYLYLFYRGEKFQVFDMDTRQKVDEKTDGFMTPRYTYVDENGILWGCGASDFLYRYDPTTGVSAHVSIPQDMFPVDTTFNCLGITGDGEGKLYFGTYNRGYLGMYDLETKEFSRLSGWLDINDYDDSISDAEQVPDTMHAGYAGLIVDNGYIYTMVDGNKNGDQETTHAVIKYSIAERKIVHHLDISDYVADGAAHMYNISLVGDVLFCSAFSSNVNFCTIDVSGERMQLIDIDCIKDGYYGGVSEEINGKAYLMGDCMLELDLATRTVRPIEKWSYKQMRLYHNTLATITWDDRLPGQSVVTVVNNKQVGSVEVLFYNPQTMEMVAWEGLTTGEGNGNQLQNMTIDPSGENIYVSAYGNNQVAEYNVATGTVTKLIPTYNHQTDGLFWYDGYLYGGNYSSATITRIDVETGRVQPLFELYESAFQQRRMHAMTAGDQKIFAGPTPDSNMYGGVLVWYDLDQQLTYVAAGPDPEDVYYADTADLSVPHVWYSALTGEKADFDQDNDGVDDSYITLDTDTNGDGEKDIVQRFNGVIENQIINCMVYRDGYIYGSTSKHGGSGTTFDKYEGCANLFVYDVAAMRLVATYDLCDTIEDLKTPIEMIEVIAADPDVDGKFWGVVSDTLFSFTFDVEKVEFSVKEELSFGKKNYYTSVTNMGHRSIVFDGDYMYVVFGGAGTFMINRNNMKDRYLLAIATPRKMVLANDGNLYVYVQGDMDISVLRTADITQSLVAESVQARIDALPENVTNDDDAVVAAVRRAYDALSDVAKQIVDITKLEAAEAVLAPNRAAAVEALINAIGTVTPESGKKIHTAREAYEVLLDAEKALVTNLSTLTAAEAAYAAFKDTAAAEAVIAKIDAIGTVTLESEEAIKAARTAYDALTDAQKALVSNLDVLIAAEAAYEDTIREPSNPSTGDAVQPVLLLLVLFGSISAICTVLVCWNKKKTV